MPTICQVLGLVLATLGDTLTFLKEQIFWEHSEIELISHYVLWCGRRHQGLQELHLMALIQAECSGKSAWRSWFLSWGLEDESENLAEERGTEVHFFRVKSTKRQNWRHGTWFWESGISTLKVYWMSRGKLLVVQLLSCVQLFVTPWTAAHWASLTFTISPSLLRFMATGSVMLTNHLILCPTAHVCPQSFPASGSFPVSWLFASGGQSIGASASASVLPMSI